MKLTIIIIIYMTIMAVGLSVLAMLIREASGGKWTMAAFVPLGIAEILLLFPLVGALLPDGPMCWFFQKWGNIFIGYFIYYYLTLLVLWLISLIFILKKKDRRERSDLRRKWSGALLIFPLILSVLINAWGMHAAHDVKVTGYEMDKEILGLDSPARVVLVGDLHIGVNSTPDLYRDMVDRINEQDADLVVVAGDLVTSSFGAMADPDVYAEIFRGINSRLGVYAVYGNHDVDEPLLGGFTFAGAENAKRNPAMEGWVKDCGWTLLKDESIRITELNDMVLIGRRDETRPGDGVTERAELKDLTRGVTEDDGVLLLEHEPSDLDEMGDLGVDLSVSGHTHDGQIFPGNIFCRVKGPQSYGMKEWGSASAIVTSGVGYYGPPIRVCTISEIVIIDFK